MRVNIGDDQYKLSFKHTPQFIGDDGSGPTLLPAGVFELGGRKRYRGMTMCFISKVIETVSEPDGNPVQEFKMVTEGRALCSEYDAYTKEEGRQYALRHALKMVPGVISIEEGSYGVTRGWMLTPESPFTPQETFEILRAYFQRPRTRPIKITEEQMAKLLDKTVQVTQEAVKASVRLDEESSTATASSAGE